MANIKIQPEKRYLYIEKKSAGNMKTTSIYTLFFMFPADFFSM